VSASSPDLSDPIATATMYFIEGDSVVPVAVEVPALGVRAYLAALEAGPPAGALDDGVRTALTPGLITAVDLGVDSITVDLDGERFATVDTQDQQFLIAQIVLSLTDLPDYSDGDAEDLPTITRVRFTLDGVPLQVFGRDNTLTEPGQYVTRDDYGHLLTGGASVGAATSSTTTGS
jgi:hypothetical protein